MQLQPHPQSHFSECLFRGAFKAAAAPAAAGKRATNCSRLISGAAFACQLQLVLFLERDYLSLPLACQPYPAC